MSSNPTASVVVPLLNCVDTIGELLDSLASQDYAGTWEVIVADNGSTDASAEKARHWMDRLPDLRIITCSANKGTGYALNAGTQAARGSLIAYCHADDVVSCGWLAAVVGSLQAHDLATGPIDLAMLNPYRLYAWRRASGWQQLPRWLGYLQPVMGCNMAVRRETFDLVGGFEVTMATASDFDFAWRVQLAGGTLGFAPEAIVHWRLRRGWAYLMRSFSYGSEDVQLFRRFRWHGLRRRPLRGVARLAGVAVGVPLLLVPTYRYGWMTLAGVELGRIKGSLATHTWFL